MAPELEVPADATLEVRPKSIPWPLVWSIFAFIAGLLVQGGMGWARNTSSIDNMAQNLSDLKIAINVLSNKYTDSHESVAVELQRIEGHLSYDDGRLDRIESHEK